MQLSGNGRGHMHIPPSLIAVCWITFLILVWDLGAAGFLPRPLDVIWAFPSLLEDGLGVQLWTSLTLNFIAAGLIFLISLVIAYATAFPEPWGSIFRPLAAIVSCGRFNGMVGLPLIFMSLLHNPHWVKVSLLVFGTSVYSVLSLVGMIESIPQEQFDLARTLRMNRWHVFWEVVVLGRFDEVLNIMRVNWAMCWMLLPLVEGYFKFEGGIGTLMLVSEKHLSLDSVVCLLFVITGVGFLQDCGIRQFRSILCPYADLGMERR